jgi:flavodoxin
LVARGSGTGWFRVDCWFTGYPGQQHGAVVVALGPEEASVRNGERAGQVETDGYTFDDSEAVIDGKFIGLPLDDINEDDKTDTRIDAWLSAITPSL